MEKERNELRLSNDRLETRVSDSPHQADWPTCAECQAQKVPWGFQLSKAGISTGGDSLPHQPQISELTSELTDERNTGESASQLLDAEAAERLRAEKEMKELQVRAGPGWRQPCW